MNFDDIQVNIDRPYPEIVDAKENYETVKILRSLATSKGGELGAILQYTYQSVVADSVMPEVASILEEIAIVEMEHLDLLMHAIKDFGALPKYEDAQGNVFSASAINYSTKLKDMLDLDIFAESKAIEDYTMAIQRVENQSLKALFARIIEDEKRHLEIFKKIRDNVQFLSL